MTWTAFSHKMSFRLRRRVRRTVLHALGVFMLIIVLGCGGNSLDTDRLKRTWLSHASDHFVFYVPPDSPRAARIADFAVECEQLLDHVIRVLQIEPDEPIDFFLFTTDAECDSLLGRPAGFFADGQIFIRIGQQPNGYIALAGCRFVDKEAESFDVLKSGIYQLYAQPSVNVHVETFAFELSNRLIPLAELDDPTLEKDPAVYQTEAASFCAFLLARHGPERFKMLWRSVLSFSDSLEKIYRLELSRLENQWRNYYRREARRT